MVNITVLQHWVVVSIMTSKYRSCHCFSRVRAKKYEKKTKIKKITEYVDQEADI